jgi:hypothetical protein
MRRRERQVDDAIVQEGPAIVDAHDDALAGRDVRHARVRRQRQRRVRRGHRIHVVRLADRRFLAVELAPVPRGDAALVIRIQYRCRNVFAAEDRIRSVRRAMQRFDARHGVGNRVEIGRRARAGTVVQIIFARRGGCAAWNGASRRDARAAGNEQHGGDERERA